MTAYFIANVRQVAPGPDIVEYLQRIDATLAVHEGRFLVHGDEPEAVEGTWRGQVIVIAFPGKGNQSDPLLICGVSVLVSCL